MLHNSNKDGYVILVGVLIIGAVAFSVSSSVLLLGLDLSRSSFVEQQSYQSQTLADACGEIAAKKLKDDSNYDPGASGETINIGSSTCLIEMDPRPCVTSCTINATGTMGSVTRKTQITATSGGGGGSLILGKGVFPDPNVSPPTTLSYTAAGSTGGITVRDNAGTPNRPVNENFIIAAATKPVIRTNDNRVNVGDSVTLSGTAFNSATLTDASTCNCGLVGVLPLYCATLTFGGVTSPGTNNPDLGTTGSFTGYTYVIPAVPYGRKNLTGVDKGTGICPGNTGGAAPRTSEIQVFFVEPKITATACSGTPKTTTINGTGFAANSTVTIIWDNADTVTTRTTGATGSFTSTVNFTLPITGTHKIGARDADRNYASNISHTCTF